MTHFGVFGKSLDADQALVIEDLIKYCLDSGIRLTFFERIYNEASKYFTIPENVELSKSTFIHSAEEYDFIVSVGGDGTLLEAARLTRESAIPIVGINLGRLGFLASIEKKFIHQAIENLISGEYTIEQRSLLHFSSNETQFQEFPYALNDMTLIKRDHSSMVIIDVTIDNALLNSYWADGVILSTPTGSTGYNLSAGGPILWPTASNFVITPIAPHNLNVRPLVLPDTSKLTFTIQGRTENFLCTLDSRYEVVSADTKITVSKAPFFINLVRLPKITFLKTLRDKLLWGRDIRNHNVKK